jgi:hypothetical protein
LTAAWIAPIALWHPIAIDKFREAKKAAVTLPPTIVPTENWVGATPWIERSAKVPEDPVDPSAEPSSEETDSPVFWTNTHPVRDANAPAAKTARA